MLGSLEPLLRAAVAQATSLRTQRLAVHSAVFAALLAALVAAAAAIYALLYAAYVPLVAVTAPIFLQYAPPSPPAATIAFALPTSHVNAEPLKPGQFYNFAVELDVPESEANLDIGNFMVTLDLISASNTTVAHSSRPAIVRYKSPLLRHLTTYWKIGLLLLDLSAESQRLAVPLIENYQEMQGSPTNHAIISISNKRLQTYHAQLRIEIHFQGLRYFMYHWWLTTAMFFIGLITLAEALLLSAFWRILETLMSTDRDEGGVDVNYGQEDDAEGDGGDGEFMDKDGDQVGNAVNDQSMMTLKEDSRIDAAGDAISSFTDMPSRRLLSTRSSGDAYGIPSSGHVGDGARDGRLQQRHAYGQSYVSEYSSGAARGGYKRDHVDRYDDEDEDEEEDGNDGRMYANDRDRMYVMNAFGSQNGAAAPQHNRVGGRPVSRNMGHGSSGPLGGPYTSSSSSSSSSFAHPSYGSVYASAYSAPFGSRAGVAATHTHAPGRPASTPLVSFSADTAATANSTTTGMHLPQPRRPGSAGSAPVVPEGGSESESDAISPLVVPRHRPHQQRSPADSVLSSSSDGDAFAQSSSGSADAAKE